MSAHNFARPDWVSEVLGSSHPGIRPRPQFTTRAYLSSHANATTETLLELYNAAQTEHHRLTHLLVRLEKQKGLLIDGRIDPYSEVQRARLDREERLMLEAAEDWEYEVWSAQAVETAREGLRELYEGIVKLKEKILETERQIKKMRRRIGSSSLFVQEMMH